MGIGNFGHFFCQLAVSPNQIAALFTARFIECWVAALSAAVVVLHNIEYLKLAYIFTGLIRWPAYTCSLALVRRLPLALALLNIAILQCALVCSLTLSIFCVQYKEVIPLHLLLDTSQHLLLL